MNKNKLVLFRQLFFVGFKSLIIYKGAILANILTSGIFLLFQIELFQAIARNSYDALDLSYLIRYFILIQLFRLFLPLNMNGAISQEVKTGNIAYRLLRPLSFKRAFFYEYAGRSLFKTIVMGFPFYIYFLWLLDLSLLSISRLVTILIFAVLSFVFQFYFELILGVASFYLLNTWGIESFKDAILIIFSGQLLPLSLYPSLVRKVVHWMPFRIIYDIPISICLDTNTENVLGLLLFTLFWIAIFMAFYEYLYSRFINHITIQGG